MRKIFLGVMALFVFGTAGLGVIKVVGSISKAQAATTCIITLFGKQYDVAPLQAGHPGGNVFACGTDMTATYQGMHGTDVTIMLPYLVTTPTPTSVPVPTSTVTPTSTPLPTPIQSGPTVVPLPTVTQAPALTGSHDDEDENEADEREHEAKKQIVQVHVKAEVKKKNDDKKGQHLVGVNSAHGIMDNTIKNKR